MTTNSKYEHLFSGYYILDGHNPVKCDDMKIWSAQDRKIKKSHFGEVEVSTVFLGISHGQERGFPILFETLVFGGEYDGHMLRYTQYHEALEGHDEVCYMVNKIAIDRENKLNELGLK